MSEKHGESKLRQDFHKVVRRAGATVWAVEGGGMGGTPGIPDSTWIGRWPALLDGDGLALGWVEHKVLRREDIPANALRGDVPVTTGLKHFTAQQRVWLTKYAEAGGRCHVLLRVDHPDESRFYLYEGAWAAAHLGVDVNFRDLDPMSLLDRGHHDFIFPDPDHMVRALLRSAPVRTPP